MGELPTINTCSVSSSHIVIGGDGLTSANCPGNYRKDYGFMPDEKGFGEYDKKLEDLTKGFGDINKLGTAQAAPVGVVCGPVKLKKEEKQMPGKRLVRVIIIDPDPRIEAEDSLLHKGKELLTELDNQELFYELNIKELLDKHNASRSATEDKKASLAAGKKVYLEPVRIRDLVMSVVEIAVF